jgi:hypothetical protein
MMRSLALTLLAFALACGEPQGSDDPESLDGIADTLEGDSALMTTARQDSAVTAPSDSIDPPAVLTISEDEPENWTRGTLERASTVQEMVALLTAVRTGRHEEFERIVIELSDQGTGIPGYHVEYIDKPLIECGSGEQVFPVGDGWLEIRMQPLDAHTQEGQPTVSHRPVRTPGLENVAAIYMTCDFEAMTTLVIAVRSPNDFRVFDLASPRRIVVDIQK